MPHLLYDNFKDLKKCARHIEKNKTILRHIDVSEMIRFICYINDNNFINDKFKINNYFECIEEILTKWNTMEKDPFAFGEVIFFFPSFIGW